MRYLLFAVLLFLVGSGFSLELLIKAVENISQRSYTLNLLGIFQLVFLMFILIIGAIYIRKNIILFLKNK